MRYIGYAYIILALAIVIVSFIKKRDYDEYQTSILEKAVITMGVALVFFFPVALLLVLSDPSYSIEALMFLLVAHWSSVLIADLIYVIKYSK